MKSRVQLVVTTTTIVRCDSVTSTTVLQMASSYLDCNDRRRLMVGGEGLLLPSDGHGLIDPRCALALSPSPAELV